MKRILLTCLTLLILPVNASAHGIWITERFGNQAIVYGHGASDDYYDFEKISEAHSLDQEGTKSPVTIKKTAAHATLKPLKNTAVLIATFDNGYWSKTKDGKWHNTAKSETPGAVFTGHYSKFTTSILDKTVAAFTPSGMKLEIVPLINPLTLHQGESLPIQVYYNEKPAEGLKVIGEYTTDGETTSGTTDGQGKATVTIRNQGLNVIAVSHTSSIDNNPELDEEGYFSTLSFSLDHSHD